MKQSKNQGQIYKQIPDTLMVKSYKYGNTLEITDAPSPEQTIKILPGHKYQDLRSGKIKDMKLGSKNRGDNLKSVKASLARLRRIIGANFHGGKSELWVTLTYKIFMHDTKIVYRDFKVFMQRIRKLPYGRVLEYLAVLEPQASGSWHLHVLLKRNDNKQLYISNNQMESLWRHGFTKTKRLKQTDKVSAYLMAYLTDLALDDDQNNKPKRIAKGARLHLYPPHTKIYRFSKGIKKPIIKRDYKGNLLANNGISKDADKRYKRSFTHDDQEIIITTEFYNQ